MSGRENNLVTPVFTHYTSARQRYAPHEMAMTNNKMGLKNTSSIKLHAKKLFAGQNTQQLLLILWLTEVTNIRAIVEDLKLELELEPERLADDPQLRKGYGGAFV